MRRIFLLLILSFSLSVGTSEAFADRNDHRNPRQEQRGARNKNRPGGNKHSEKNYNHKNHNHGHKDHHITPRPGVGSHPRPGVGSDQRPGTPPPPPPPPAPAPMMLPPMLQQMVMNVTAGCYDINVWQVNPESFIVKYKRGNRLFTRMLYPYAGQYGRENLISVNWQPLNPWTFIPPIQLNINF